MLKKNNVNDRSQWVVISEEDVTNVVSMITGIPLSKVAESETAEEPNITTTVEDVEERPVPEEVVEVASETANDVTESASEKPSVEEVKSSDNDLENRVKELEEKLNNLFNILPIWAKGCANFPIIPDDLIKLL